RADLLRRAHADRVAERDIVATHAVEFAREVGDRARRHLALVRAARYHGDIAAYPHALRFRGLHDGREAVEALGDAAVDVLPAERLRRRAEYRYFLGAGVARRLESLHVGNEHGVGHARPLPDPGHDFGVVGHLRHPLG